jgi:hypothetical protein
MTRLRLVRVRGARFELAGRAILQSARKRTAMLCRLDLTSPKYGPAGLKPR